MVRRLILTVLVLAVLAAAALLTWPQSVGLQRQTGVAQLLAFRIGMAAGAVVLGFLCFVLAAFIRPLRALLAWSALIAVVFAGVNVAIPVTRGFDGRVASVPAGGLTVLEWNTKGDAPGADEIAAVALGANADIVSLPDTSLAAATKAAAKLTAKGRPMQAYNVAFDQVVKAHSTSLLVSTALGAYRLVTGVGGTTMVPSGVFVPVSGSGPTIVAAHAVSPVPSQMSAWRQGLDWLAAHCAGANTIMAGDFNANVDHLAGLGQHGGVGACADAATQTRAAANGSWPTGLPAVVGTQIDHVMFGSAWRAASFKVIGSEDGAGSDHRPVVAVLAPAASAPKA